MDYDIQASHFPLSSNATESYPDSRWAEQFIPLVGSGVEGK